MSAWREHRGALFVHYSGLQRNHPQYGSWGAKKFTGQAPATAPKYQALLRHAAAVGASDLFGDGFETP